MTSKPVALSTVKRGDYVRLSAGENAPVWIRGDYDRTTKRYGLESWADAGREIQRKGATLVWVDFTF